MSFPVVLDVTGSQTLDNVTGTATLPATVNAGDLLLLIYHKGLNSVQPDTPAGWVAGATTSVAGGGRIGLLSRLADGSEDGTALNLTGSAGTPTWAFLCVRIQAGTWFDNGSISTTNVSSVAANHGTVSTPNPPSVNPSQWDVEDTLWAAACGSASAAATLTTAPTGFTNPQSEIADGTTDIATHCVFREEAVASKDPDTYVLGASAPCASLTIAVRPAAAGTVSPIAHHYRRRRTA